MRPSSSTVQPSVSFPAGPDTKASRGCWPTPGISSRDRALVADIRAQVVSKSAGPSGREEAPGRRWSIWASSSVRRSWSNRYRRRDGVGQGPRSTAVRPPPLRGELRLPRVRVTCAIGPADVHLGETLDGPREGPLAPVTPPHAAAIGGTVRVEPVGRGDPPQDDLIHRARGIVQGAPTVHSVENGRTTGNLRKRGLDQVNPHCPMAPGR
jgi:hypothetical protein